MRFKYEDVFVEIIEGDIVHPQIFSFENQYCAYSRVDLSVDEETGRCKKCCFDNHYLCSKAPRCGRGDTVYDGSEGHYPEVGKTESACYFVKLNEDPRHKINYDALLIEKMEI